VSQALAKAAQDTDENVRAAAVGFLSGHPGKEATRLLIDLLPSQAVKEPITAALALPVPGRMVASDISPRVLARAREGVFGKRALRHVPVPALANRYLQPSGDTVRVRPDILAAVDYRRVNLLEEGQVRALGTFDVILCRNVLIYFREERVRMLLQHLANALVPQGALFVGASESLLRFGTAFQCEERSGIFYYRKSP
jgi:chemotaxis protein methyltransferase CheR